MRGKRLAHKRRTGRRGSGRRTNERSRRERARQGSHKRERRLGQSVLDSWKSELEASEQAVADSQRLEEVLVHELAEEQIGNV